MTGMTIGSIHTHLFCEILEKNTKLDDISFDINLKNDDNDIVYFL